MSEIDKGPTAALPTGDGTEPASGAVVSPSKRRLIKLGAAAVPVAASLASRPVMAWQCQSPSAWGSEKINPTTSLKGTQGHNSYPDEVWTISNWKDNSYRSAASYSKPWEVLVNKYPGCKSGQTTFDYTKATLGTVCGATGIAAPAGASSTATVVTILSSGSELQKYTLVAQLNFICLSSLSTNEIERCVTIDKLKTMATGTYSPLPGVVWGQTDIKTYLYSNYIAVP